VYIFGLSTVYMVLAMAETPVLLLAEVDLSTGAVALIGGVIAFKLVQQPGRTGRGGGGARRARLLRRDRRPPGSAGRAAADPVFVVTLAGFLLFSGILIVILAGPTPR